MKYNIFILIVCIVAVLLNACNRDELFEREQYKAVVAIKSGTDNFFSQILDLNSKEKDEDGFVRGSISANVGGTSLTKEDIVITVTEDASMLHTYNLYNHETDARKYYRFLPKNRYKIPETKIVIPAGQNSGSMPIWINANGLSPDSVYIIPFRVVRCSAYEMNPEKSTVFYRVERKNNWSYTSQNGTVLAAPSYQQRGRFLPTAIPLASEIPPLNTEYTRLLEWLESPGLVRPTTTQTVANKTVYLLSHNELRVLGRDLYGVATGADAAVFYPQWSINIRITDEKVEGTNQFKLEITPWREDHIEGIEIEQVDDDNFDPNNRYLNTYELVTDDWGFQYHVFRLCYDYVHGVHVQEVTKETTPIKRRMWEELKLEYVVDLTKR